MSAKTAVILAVSSIGAVALWSLWRAELTPTQSTPPAREPLGQIAASPDEIDRLTEYRFRAGSAPQEVLDALAARLRQRLERADAREREALLTFKDAAARDRFLARAAAAGLQVKDRIDDLNTVRVDYETSPALARELLANAADYAEVAANFLIGPPAPPQAQERAARAHVPVGNRLLELLGVNGDVRSWGRGVNIAVLDSGVAPDTTFGLGRVRTLDIGLGTKPSAGSDSGHGTAVAALVAGMSPDAQGVAPAADILSIRVTADDGKSDSFTVARAIFAAVESGAKIINVSLGGYGTSSALQSAIDHATTRGVVIVASAGNDQAAQLTWPAADPRVISVGAVDATGQQVMFSNSGERLQLAAPGYGIQTAWGDGSRILFNGTSASAPIVAGSIAALMSQDPSLSAQQAWRVLQQHASEAGPEGADPVYGYGVLNLGWAMARNDATRIDTAVASHVYSASAEQMEFVVQNRSAQAVAGLNLNVAINGSARRFPISWLGPGATTVVRVPLSSAQLSAAQRIEFSSELSNPSGIIDQVPANNTRSSALIAPQFSKK